MYDRSQPGGPPPCARGLGTCRHECPSLPSPEYPGSRSGPGGRGGEGGGEGRGGEGRGGEGRGGEERGGEGRGGEGRGRERGGINDGLRVSRGELTAMPHQPQRKLERQSEVAQVLAHTWQRASDGRLPSIQWCLLRSWGEKG